MELTSAIALASQAISLSREFLNVEKEFDKAALKMRVAELTDKLVEVKQALIEAKDELGEKDKLIEKIRADFQRLPELEERDGFLFERAGSIRAEGHPYCPRCHAVDARLIRTVRAEDHMNSVCPHCKQVYVQVSAHSQRLIEHERSQMMKFGGDPFSY